MCAPVVIARQEWKLERGMRSVVLPHDRTIAERRIAHANDLSEIVQAVGEAGPIAAEYAEVDDGVRGIVVPEHRMLPNRGVTGVTGCLHVFVKRRRDGRSGSRIAAG